MNQRKSARIVRFLICLLVLQGVVLWSAVGQHVHAQTMAGQEFAGSGSQEVGAAVSTATRTPTSTPTSTPTRTPTPCQSAQPSQAACATPVPI